MWKHVGNCLLLRSDEKNEEKKTEKKKKGKNMYYFDSINFRLALHSNSERHMKVLEKRKSSLLLSVSDQTKPSIVQSISKANSDKVEKK